MAVVDPRGGPRSLERFQLRIHEIQPEDILPNGDRYTVEVIEMAEQVLLGSLLVVTQTPSEPGGPQSDPAVERRGVFAAVVIRAGNGHLLGLPDQDHVLTTTKGDRIERTWASVEMFFKPGDVLLIDHNARGRALMIVGREVRLVNQIDILAKVDGVRLERVDGAWVQVDA
jgi:hypothetical protein